MLGSAAFFDISLDSCWTNSQVDSYLEWHDAYLTSLKCFKLLLRKVYKIQLNNHPVVPKQFFIYISSFLLSKYSQNIATAVA